VRLQIIERRADCLLEEQSVFLPVAISFQEQKLHIFNRKPASRIHDSAVRGELTFSQKTKLRVLNEILYVF
jgi:hypothetical protein